MNVEEFYNNISSEYTELLERAIPNYREMLSQMFRYVPNNFAGVKILELGCGTGNLTALIIEQFPEADLVVVDISKNILKECQNRFSGNSHIKYVQKDFNEINFLKDEFDLIISSIAIHHIQDQEKQQLFKKLNGFLNNRGILIYADQCRGATDEIYRKHLDTWKMEAFKLGSSNMDWELWMQHQDEHDHHATINDQLNWLKQASYNHVDVLWKKLLWTVFYAEK